MGDVIAFPVAEKTCYECIHLALTGTGSSYCTLFNEPILSEKIAAEDCEAFERE